MLLKEKMNLSRETKDGELIEKIKKVYKVEGHRFLLTF